MTHTHRKLIVLPGQMHMKLKLILFILICIKQIKSDDYLKETQTKCFTSNNGLFYCALYKVSRTIQDFDFGETTLYGNNNSSYLRLVKLPERNYGMQEMFPTSRQTSEDSEFTKFFKFLKRKSNGLFGSYGLSVALPGGISVVHENEIATGRKGGGGGLLGGGGKDNMIVPLMMIVMLTKIKILTALAVAGIFVIKTALIVAAIAAPSILHSIKAACKKDEEHHYYTKYEHPEEYVEKDHGWV